jgi:N,N-dimethylformamidase beta subunit-like, C-terminal
MRQALSLFAALLVLTSAGASAAEVASPATAELEAYFSKRSYSPGSTAWLAVRSDSRSLTVEVFRAGGEQGRTRGRSTLRGLRVMPKFVFRRSRAGWGSVPVRLHYWPSGLYFARVRAGGRIYFAPFVLRATPNIRSRVAVVMPTNTWQAYNFRDDDDDGIPNTWYANEAVTTVDLSRPFLDRGVPPHFRAYDLGFIRWLTLTGKTPDFLAEDDLERTGARGLLARYDLIVFPGHHEYVTDREYNAVEGYRNLGGNLMFLSANNFFRRVVRSGDLITRAEQWRELGRPESRWMGVQYVDWNLYAYGNQPYLVVGKGAAPWLFRKTGLHNGSRFGRFGIEIDARTPFSPPGTKVLAILPDIFGPGKTGEMTYHTTPSGAKVFSAGAFTLGGGALVPPMRQLVANLWEELSRP